MINKFTVGSLQLAVFLLLLTTNYQLPTIFAASPSPSPNKSQTEFQQKVEDLKKDAATKAAEMKSQVSKTIQNKAYIGKVNGLQGKQIFIQTPKATKTVNTDEYTLFQDTAKKNFAFADIKKDDFLVALGDVDDNQVLKAKKIIRLKTPEVKPKYVVWGQTQSIVSGTITLTKQDNQKITIKTDAKTIYRLGSDDVALSDLKQGNFIISVGSGLLNNQTTAAFIYFPASKNDLSIKKEASSSATPSASPKKTP